MSEAVLVPLALSVLGTAMSFLTRPSPPERGRPKTGESQLRPDQPIVWIIGRQAVACPIFAQTATRADGEDSTFWAAIGEGPICCCYSMRISDVPIYDHQSTDYSPDEDPKQEFRRVPMIYFNGSLDDTEITEIQDDTELNELGHPLDGDNPQPLVRPGDEIQRYPGTAYFGIRLLAGNRVSGIPQFSMFVEGLLLPKIKNPTLSNARTLYVDDHNKWITWLRNSTHYAAEIKTGLGGAGDYTPSEIATKIGLAMTAVDSNSYSCTIASETSVCVISGSAAFSLTPRSGGHYGNSIFEDLGFYTHHDLGDWDIGEAKATNHVPAPFCLNLPEFLTFNDQHEDLIDEVVLTGKTSHTSRFTWNETFSDDPIRAKYFFEKNVFKREVDEQSFYDAWKKTCTSIKDGSGNLTFYDQIPLESQYMKIIPSFHQGFPTSHDRLLTKEQAKSLWYHGSLYTSRVNVTVPEHFSVECPFGFVFDKKDSTIGGMFVNPDSSVADEFFVIVDLGNQFPVIKIEILQQFRYKLKIEYSTDNITYSDFKDFTSDDFDEGLSEEKTSPITLRYLKFHTVTVHSDDFDSSHDFYNGSRDSTFSWLVKNINIYEGYPSRYARMDYQFDRALTRKKIHELIDVTFGIFSNINEEKMQPGVYKSEDSSGFITDESILPETFKINSLESSSYYNQLLFSYFDIHDNFNSHPIILNDTASQNRLAYDLDAEQVNEIIQGPRNHLVGHTRRQQAFRYAETQMLAQEITPYGFDFEATRDAQSWIVGKVYEVSHVFYNESGVIKPRLGTVTGDNITTGQLARLKRKIRYADHRYSTQWEFHDDNVFQPDPHLFTPIVTRFNPISSRAIGPVRFLEVEIIPTHSSVSPSDLLFRLTWLPPHNSYNFVGAHIGFTVSSGFSEEQIYINIGRSVGVRYAEVRLTRQVEVNSTVVFHVTALNSFGDRGHPVLSRAVYIHSNLFKPLPVANLRIWNQLDKHPTWYTQNVVLFEWNATGKTGKNVGPKNRNQVGKRNDTLKDRGQENFVVRVQAWTNIDDTTLRYKTNQIHWKTLKEYRITDSRFSYHAIQNQEDWVNYQLKYLSVKEKGIIDHTPLKLFRIGVSQVNSLGGESEPLYIEATHKGDWRRIEGAGTQTFLQSKTVDSSFIPIDALIDANDNLVVMFFESGAKDNTTNYIRTESFQARPASCTAIDHVDETLPQGGKCFETSDGNIHFLYQKYDVVKYSSRNDADVEIESPADLYEHPEGIGGSCFAAAGITNTQYLFIRSGSTSTGDPPVFSHTMAFESVNMPTTVVETQTIGTFPFPPEYDPSDTVIRGLDCVYNSDGTVDVVATTSSADILYFKWDFLNAYFRIHPIKIGSISIRTGQSAVAVFDCMAVSIHKDSDGVMLVSYFDVQTREFGMIRFTEIDDEFISIDNEEKITSFPRTQPFCYGFLFDEGRNKLLTLSRNIIDVTTGEDKIDIHLASLTNHQK